MSNVNIVKVILKEHLKDISYPRLEKSKYKYRMKRLFTLHYIPRGDIIKNRYLIIKKIYEDYLILINNKDKLITFARDKDILEYIKFKKVKDLEKRKINYLILDNLEIVTKREYNDLNNYKEYLLKSFIDKVLYKIKEELK